MESHVKVGGGGGIAVLVLYVVNKTEMGYQLHDPAILSHRKRSLYPLNKRLAKPQL